MIEIGKKQELKVVHQVEFGVYLGEEESTDQINRVLLPQKQVPDNTKKGDVLSVFVYRDSEDRLIATTREPFLQIGELAKLKVKEVNKFGAFLDWGLEKDLFLPYKEQTGKVYAGDWCIVTLYADKSNRLCATMKVYHYLRQDSPYKKEDKVQGTVYEISERFGAFVAVDDKYSALIPKKEFFDNAKVGDEISARVTRVLEDGKLELSIREKAYLQIEKDAIKVLEIIASYDGVLPFTDKANPEVIRRETGMSKNEFKRAIGNLLKKGKITIHDKCIRSTIK